MKWLSVGAIKITKATPGIVLASFLVGTILGVALSSWLTGISLIFGAIVAVDLVFVVIKRAPWRDRLLLTFLFVIGIVFGLWRYAAVGSDAYSVAQLTGGPHAIKGTIVDVDWELTQQKITLGNLAVADATASGRVLISAPAFPKLQTGQIVQTQCRIETPEPFDGFRYDRFLASKNIYATCYLREVPLIVGQSQRFVALDRLHEQALESIHRIFGEPHGTLLAGLLMGDNDFSDEWQDYFLRTGTSHVVAASGYNVSMLALVLFAILINIGLRRQYAYPFVLLGIAGFVMIAGAEAAVTRAGIMGALALSATQLGRKTSPRNILLLTIALMLVAEPRLLRDSVGFQLSVLSTIGLMTIATYFSEKFAFIPETLGLRESFAATVAATLATLPVIIFGFGRFSIVSPLVNLLVLPFVPYAMLTGMVATILGVFSQSLGALFAGPAWLFLSAILEIIQAIAALPFAVINLSF
jgi:competence protein ComEC